MSRFALVPWRHLLVILVGSLSGVISSHLYHTLHREDGEREIEHRLVLHPDTSLQTSPDVQRILGAAWVDELMDQRRNERSETETAVNTETESTDRAPSREVERDRPTQAELDAIVERRDDEFRSFVQGHYVQTRDHQWSQRAEADITRSLDEMDLPSGLHVMQVDCRTDTCVLELEWDDARTAQRHFGVLLRRSLGVNCIQATRLLDLESTDVGLSYRSQVFLDCSEDEHRGYGWAG